ncbi:MAG: formate dehydrogenase accessory sulfurtransferase FdhD [Bacteroidetes bacterium]|nr:MAG: formate dehydrogenase accessory sulfurtransferase FdhD [Bacteroidota bacterium]
MSPAKTERIWRIRGREQRPCDDELAVEEPLEIRLAGGPLHARWQRRLTITLRTPGADEELALGFLLAEGVIAHQEEVLALEPLHDPRTGTYANVLRATLAPDVEVDWQRFERQFVSTAACGLCGRAVLDTEWVRGGRVQPGGSFSLDEGVLRGLPAAMRAAQSVFSRTGGLHAAALFTSEGELDLLREDIGRHNAVDKVIGAAFRRDASHLSRRGLLVSGRAGFELVQKAVVAGIPLMAAIGAPSSLGVEVARACGLTLVGFLNAGGFNVYSAPERIRFS